MKKANLLVILVALGVIAWAVPAVSVRATTHNAVLTVQQDEPSEPAAQETESQTLMGQIANQDGTYTLKAKDGKTCQLDDQDGPKNFDGEEVKVTGSLNEEGMTIYVNEIKEAEA